MEKGDLLTTQLQEKLAEGFTGTLFLAAVSIIIIFVARDNLGNLFGTSDEAALEIAIATPVFLVGMFFYAYSRICSSAFYSTERETLS